MRKFFKQIHIWLSIPFGVVITIICFTGALLIFEDEITRSVQRDYYYVESVDASPLSFADVVERVKPHLSEGQDIKSITVPRDSSRTWKVNLTQPARRAIYVNQYTGEVLGTPERLGFFKVVFRLHRWLMDERPSERDAIYWGKLIVGVSTIMMIIVLISGIVIWIPKSLKMWKNRSKIALDLGWRRMLYDLHVVGGIYSVVLLLAMGLTGLTWSFPWYRDALYGLFSGDAPATSSTQLPPSDKLANVVAIDSTSAWDIAYSSVEAEYKSYKEITISDGSLAVTLLGKGNSRASDKYSFDAETGALLSADMYDSSTAQSKSRGWVYSIHVGNFGGMLTRVLWFLGALLGATLPITGYYLWIKRKFSSRR